MTAGAWGVTRGDAGDVGVAAYLHYLVHVVRFRKRLALASYNQRPASVRRHVLFPETRAFVRNVVALQRRF